MIEMHLRIMLGGKLPQSAGEAFIRYTKLMGLSTTQRPNDHRRDLSTLNYKDPQYECMRISDTLRPYLNHKATSHSSLSYLENLVQIHIQNTNNETKSRRRNAHQKLTLLQFLAAMERFLPAELSKVQFDYI